MLGTKQKPNTFLRQKRRFHVDVNYLMVEFATKKSKESTASLETQNGALTYG